MYLACPRSRRTHRTCTARAGRTRTANSTRHTPATAACHRTRAATTGRALPLTTTLYAFSLPDACWRRRGHTNLSLASSVHACWVVNDMVDILEHSTRILPRPLTSTGADAFFVRTCMMLPAPLTDATTPSSLPRRHRFRPPRHDTAHAGVLGCTGAPTRTATPRWRAVHASPAYSSVPFHTSHSRGEPSTIHSQTRAYMTEGQEG